MGRDLRRPAVVSLWCLGFATTIAVVASVPALQLSDTDQAARAAVNAIAALALLPIGALVLDRLKATRSVADDILMGLLVFLGAAAAVASADPLVAGTPAAIVVTVGLALVAAAFAGWSLSSGDDFWLWIAVGAALAAGGWLDSVLFPPGPVPALHTGGLLRLASFAALLLAAKRELPLRARRLAEASVLGERRRIARDIHDGLAQELVFLATQTRVLASNGGYELKQLAAASERALDESRYAITALRRAQREPLPGALLQTVEEVAERVGARVRFTSDPHVDASPDVFEALLRIAREAVSNATRHGGAETVDVALSNHDGIKLRVTDDGRGFDTEAPLNGGFGLISMRERAQAIGGELKVRSRPGEGAEIEVVVP